MSPPNGDTEVLMDATKTMINTATLFTAASAPAHTVLATGLGGAIGSDYRPLRNQAVFVEFGGNVSRINLLPAAAVKSSGTVTIKGTYQFDFDTGAQSPGTLKYDVWWQQMTSTTRQLTPLNGARLRHLGAVSYPSITAAELMALDYPAGSIVGSDGAANQLTNGTVFAVRTSDGNYAKAQVTQFGYNLTIQWITYAPQPHYQVLGTGYAQPEDVKVCADERYAYVTERTGTLLRVDLTNANRSAAKVVSGGMTAPHQIVLDEALNQVFLVEYAPAGRLLRVDLGTGVKKALAAQLENAIGLLLTSDRTVAYVGQQTTGAGKGQVLRIDLVTGQRQVLISGLTAPFFMTWTDAGETGILLTERDPANRVTRIDLTVSPATTQVILSAVPFRPSSVALISPTDLLVFCNDVVARFKLTPFQTTGPMLLGIGHVPVSRISRSSPLNAVSDGYADTSVDPGYFFKVKDAPFGGTLPIMFNHTRAYAEGARFYRLFVGSVEPRQSFTDYRWNAAANTFQALTTSPSASGYYRVRAPNELWYNHWLGYLLNSRLLANGLHTISIRLYSSQVASSEIGTPGLPGRTMVVRVDNSLPLVSIDQILHNGTLVNACGIVQGNVDSFTFRITAHDAEQHLRNWSMVALWGANKSKAVGADSYDAHASPTKKWAGVNAAIVPAAPWTATVAGDPTSRRCAHTFRLGAWARTIDGWNHIHYREFHKSITIMLD
jgi:hypothetical protein